MGKIMKKSEKTSSKKRKVPRSPQNLVHEKRGRGEKEGYRQAENQYRYGKGKSDTKKIRCQIEKGRHQARNSTMGRKGGTCDRGLSGRIESYHLFIEIPPRT